MIRGLHHNANRCRDSEETRQFYEGFLGLPLANAFKIGTTMTGRNTGLLHSFYEMDDGSFLAFFEAPDRDFEFKEQHDFDLHIVLEVNDENLELPVHDRIPCHCVCDPGSESYTVCYILRHLRCILKPIEERS